MAKARRARRSPSHRLRSQPYKLPLTKRHVAKKANCLEKKEWENVICSVCIECPHNAVLLLCSSHDKGCRPYMCGTSFRYSNCLDQYKKASTKLKSSINGNLTCPLCRGQVKGWTIVQPARDYLNLKKRICMQEECCFDGTFRELRKHMRVDHPCAKPREVDPVVEQNWRRFEVENERGDVRAVMPGSTVVGDYVIEGNGNGAAGNVLNAAIGSLLVNVYLLMQAFEESENEISRSDSGEVEDDDVERNSNSLASRMRRQGRVLLGRSERRRRNREANWNSSPSG